MSRYNWWTIGYLKGTAWEENSAVPTARVFLHTGGVACWYSLSEEPLVSGLIHRGEGSKYEELGPLDQEQNHRQGTKIWKREWASVQPPVWKSGSQQEQQPQVKTAGIQEMCSCESPSSHGESGNVSQFSYSPQLGFCLSRAWAGFSGGTTAAGGVHWT